MSYAFSAAVGSFAVGTDMRIHGASPENGDLRKLSINEDGLADSFTAPVGLVSSVAATRTSG